MRNCYCPIQNSSFRKCSVWFAVMIDIGSWTKVDALFVWSIFVKYREIVFSNSYICVCNEKSLASQITNNLFFFNSDVRNYFGPLSFITSIPIAGFIPEIWNITINTYRSNISKQEITYLNKLVFSTDPSCNCFWKLQILCSFQFKFSSYFGVFVLCDWNPSIGSTYCSV